jgi:hypothetical protein
MAKATEVIEIEAKSNIKEVTKDVDKLGKSVKKTAGEAEDLGQATKKGAGGFKKVGVAVRALGVAMKAIGVGLLISAFLLLKEAFAKNQTVIDGLKTAMTTITTTFNEVVSAIIEIVKWATATEGKFTALGKVLGGFVTLGIGPLKQAFQTTELAIRMFGNSILVMMNILGADNTKRMEENQRVIKALGKSIVKTGEEIRQGAIDIKENWGEATDSIADTWEKTKEEMSKIDVKGNVEKAKALTEAEKEARRAEVALQGLIEKNDRLAELQRQIRDDESKTFEERIAANDEIATILDLQEESMLAQADARIAAARLAADNNKDNLDLELALTAAINDRAAVEAQITGFRSEQKTNEVALDKELLEIKNTLAEEVLSNMDRELLELKNSYEEKIRMADKAGVETTAITKKYEDEQAKIRWDAAQKERDDAEETEQFKQQTIAMGFAALGAITAESDKLSKAVAVAKTIYNTQQAIMNTMANIPPPWNLIQAAATGIMGAMAIKKILSTSRDNATGGGIVIPNATSVAPSPEMLSGGSGFDIPEVEPARAYVVSDDITNNQNKLAIIRRRATI